MRRYLRMVDRMLELAPEMVRKPGRVVPVARGVHPGMLVSLDQPWLRAYAPDVVLDVGANTGQFAAVALHVFPQARVIGFEPLPECVAVLQRRLGRHPRFRLVATAIGRTEGTITINQSASTPSSSILPMNEAHVTAFPWTATSEPLEVPLRTLDALWGELDLAGRILLKIDVQGYGLEVLKGAAQVLAMTDLVSIETSFVPLYEGEPSFDDIYTFMVAKGFGFVGLLDSLTHPATRQPLQGDAIFRRQSQPERNGTAG